MLLIIFYIIYYGRQLQLPDQKDAAAITVIFDVSPNHEITTCTACLVTDDT